MADNRALYGFRFGGGKGGSSPDYIRGYVASGKTFSVTGGTANINLSPGDPVYHDTTDGYFTLCPGSETTATQPFGIVAAFYPYWNGQYMQPTSVLPSSTTYGVIKDRQSTLIIIPAEQCYWEIDSYQSGQATTELGYQAFIGENANHKLSGGIAGGPQATNATLQAFPYLDVSTHNVSAALMWRIVDIAPTEDNTDFTGNFVKFKIELNLGQRSPYNTTGN